MKGIYDNHPLIEFYEVLLRVLKQLKDDLQHEEFKSDKAEDDTICTLILQNNGCAFKDKVYFEDIELTTVPGYAIKLVYGGKGNAICKYFDYIEFYGTRYLVIFMDEFAGLYTDTPDPIFSRGEYVDKLSKLVDVFIQTSNPTGTYIQSSCASNMNRFAPIMISCAIIDELFGLVEADVTSMEYSEVRKMLDDLGIKLILVGIRVY